MPATWSTRELLDCLVVLWEFDAIDTDDIAEVLVAKGIVVVKIDANGERMAVQTRNEASGRARRVVLGLDDLVLVQIVLVVDSNACLQSRDSIEEWHG